MSTTTAMETPHAGLSDKPPDSVTRQYARHARHCRMGECEAGHVATHLAQLDALVAEQRDTTTTDPRYTAIEAEIADHWDALGHLATGC